MRTRGPTTLLVTGCGLLVAAFAYLLLSGNGETFNASALCTYCWIPDPWVWPTFAIGGAAAPFVSWWWNYREKTKKWEEERDRERRTAEHREYDPYASKPKQLVDFPEDGSAPILRQEEDGDSDSIPDDDEERGKWFWDKLREVPGEFGKAAGRVEDDVIEGDFHRGSLEPEEDD